MAPEDRKEEPGRKGRRDRAPDGSRPRRDDATPIGDLERVDDSVLDQLRRDGLEQAAPAGGDASAHGNQPEQPVRKTRRYASLQDDPAFTGAEDLQATPPGSATPAGQSPPRDTTPLVDSDDDESTAGDALGLAGPPASSSRASDPLLGKMVGGLVLEEAIARGGMGLIYRGRHPFLHKDFAIKILPGRLAALPPFVERFINEGRAAMRITHPAAVRVMSAGVEENIHYIVMELVHGRDLRSRVEDEGALHEHEVVRIALEVCRALTATHGIGIVHRDIKPENLLIEDETKRVRITDFGLAMDMSADLAAVEASLGTPNYMSPEQCRGLGCDARSDIYALGATCYYLLTRRPPYPGHTAASVMIQHIVAPPPDPRVYAPRTTDELATLVMRMMAKDPAGRFASAAALADEFDRLRRSDPGAAPPIETTSSAGARLTALMNLAIARRATDVHLRLHATACTTAMRIDEELVEVETLSTEVGAELIATARQLAGIVGGSLRHGLIELPTETGARRQVFVGSIAGATGETLVLRWLPPPEAYPTSEASLGLPAAIAAELSRIVERRRGMLIVAGRRNSGRGLVGYHALASLRHASLALVSIEEQIDVLLDGVTQVLVDPQHGVTHARALEQACEQDADAILIRDLGAEAWPIAFTAAEAGRLIVATTTASDGVGALAELIAAGVSATQIVAQCRAIVTTRRLPQACPRCLSRLTPNDDEIERLGFSAADRPAAIPAPTGCRECHGLGTVGLMNIYELLAPRHELIDAVRTPTGLLAARERIAADDRGFAPLKATLRRLVVGGRVRLADAIAAVADLS